MQMLVNTKLYRVSGVIQRVRQQLQRKWIHVVLGKNPSSDFRSSVEGSQLETPSIRIPQRCNLAHEVTLALLCSALQVTLLM